MIAFKDVSFLNQFEYQRYKIPTRKNQKERKKQALKYCKCLNKGSPPYLNFIRTPFK